MSHSDHFHDHHERQQERRAERRERCQWRRERRHSDTREEILDAAREVLLERGAADLSLREIARRAGFSPAALYKYFDSKDDMIKALADKAMRALLDAFGRVSTDLPPERRALELGMAYLEFSRANPEDVAVVEWHESTAHPLPLTGEHRAMEEVVKGVFRDGVEAGVFAARDDRDPAFMTYGAWALLQGLSRFERVQRSEVADSLRARQRDILHIYLNGLKTDWSGEL